MPLTGKKYNPNDYRDTATSKMSKQAFITKPENRPLGTKTKSPEAASSFLKGQFK